MPDTDVGAKAIAFGNFRAGYVIAERTATRILRDPYSHKPFVHFYATKRVGGAVVNSARRSSCCASRCEAGGGVREMRRESAARACGSPPLPASPRRGEGKMGGHSARPEGVRRLQQTSEKRRD